MYGMFYILLLFPEITSNDRMQCPLYDIQPENSTGRDI